MSNISAHNVSGRNVHDYRLCFGGHAFSGFTKTRSPYMYFGKISSLWFYENSVPLHVLGRICSFLLYGNEVLLDVFRRNCSFWLRNSSSHRRYFVVDLLLLALWKLVCPCLFWSCPLFPPSLSNGWLAISSFMQRCTRTQSTYSWTPVWSSCPLHFDDGPTLGAWSFLCSSKTNRGGYHAH